MNNIEKETIYSIDFRKVNVVNSVSILNKNAIFTADIYPCESFVCCGTTTINH